MIIIKNNTDNDNDKNINYCDEKKVMVLSESKGNEEGCRCCKILRRIQEKVLFQICKC